MTQRTRVVNAERHDAVAECRRAAHWHRRTARLWCDRRASELATAQAAGISDTGGVLCGS